MMPRRRCQPGNGATRSEPIFPTKREGPARRRRRHAMVAEALVPPDAVRVATLVATVYTNAPKRRREARSSHLCTLLRSQGHSQPKPTAQQCTQMPQNGADRPFSAICVHCCDPKTTHNPSPQPNSVHKRPKTARRGPILPFVYTIAIPRPPTTQAHGATVYTNAPKRPRGAISTDLCTLLRPSP